ncbi:MAG: CDP-alcohol phosphatidyltransferase family protein [Anaerohalosphaeraceae bacterium]|nr:CDP-alcohol phosphatidyltransferase family protein [Anaerohalosphaeraceae bacterium]
MNLNHANRVTVIRILLIVPFVICMLKINEPETGHIMRYIALGIFLVMALSDAYDGYVARRKNEVTKLGSFLDPMADKLLMTCACILLTVKRTAVAGFVLPPTVVVLIIGKDLFLLLGFMVLYFMTFQIKIFPASIGKIATALQLTMVAAILIAPETSLLFEGWIWFLRALWWSAAGTAIIATLIYIQAGSRYIDDF